MDPTCSIPPAENQADDIRWPLYVPPREDEILSSWMTRLADAHGISLQSLCRETWPGRFILPKDLDRNPPGWFLEDLSMHSGIPLARLRTMVLAELEGRLMETFPASIGRAPWIVPVSMRKAVPHGSQFCPECLREDPDPYFRRSWRIAWMTVCGKHGRLLSDSCPHCGIAPNLTIALRGEDRLAVCLPVPYCHWCGEDLRDQLDGLERSPKGTQSVILLQERLVNGVDLGWVETENGSAIHALPFFRGLQIIIKMLISKGKLGRFREAAVGISSLSDPAPLIFAPKRSAFFETQSVECRYALMSLAAWIFEDWPGRLVEVSQKVGLHAARLTQDQEFGAPYWIWKVANESLSMKFDHWRRGLLPEGVVMSYSDLGRRAIRNGFAPFGALTLVAVSPKRPPNSDIPSFIG